MSETVMIDIEMDRELIQNWNIHVKTKRYIFLRFAMFDIGCQSGSVLELVFSSTETHTLCNANKPFVGLNSTSNILKITFTFQKRANRLTEGFKADYTARNFPRLSPSLMTHEEQGNCVLFRANIYRICQSLNNDKYTTAIFIIGLVFFLVDFTDMKRYTTCIYDITIYDIILLKHLCAQ